MRAIYLVFPIFALSCREGKEVELPQPEITNVLIDREDVFTNSVLICSAEVVSEEAIFYSYQWVSGEQEIGTRDEITLDSTLVQPGDELRCTVTVRNSYGITSTASTAVLVQNTSPVINDIVISPNANIRTNDELTCTADVFDIDTSDLTIRYSWMLGDVLLEEGNEIDLGEFSITEFSEVACVVEVQDPQDVIVTDRKVVEFINTPPVIQEVNFIPNPAQVDSTIMCSAQYVQNPNEDNYTLTYVWERNGVELNVDPTVNTLEPPHSVHDLIACTVHINDGVQDGVPIRAELQISNDNPIINEVTITPQEAFVDSTLSCSGSGEDPNHVDLASSYYWQSESGDVLSTSNLLTLSENMNVVGESISCFFRLTDPLGGFSEESTSVTILNSAPHIDSVTISDLSAQVGDTVTCTGQGNDINNDSLSWTYRWFDGQGIELGTDSSLTITADNTDRAQLVFCEATVTDGEYSVSQQSSLYIDNSSPVITSIHITPNPGTSYETFQCVVESEDPDLDSVSLLYAWRVDGVAQNVTGDTLFPSFDVGALIECEAIVDDGLTQSAPQSTTAFVQNTDPTIAAIEISPQDPIQNSILTCSALAEDLDIDSSMWSSDLNILYQWTDSSGVIISNQSQLQLYDNFSSFGDEFFCTATVIDPQGGSVSSTTSVTVTNSTPVFTEQIQISALDASVGDTLTCSAVAEDEQDGALDISYEWSNQNGVVLSTEESLSITADNTDPDDIITCQVQAEDSVGEAISESTSISVKNTIPILDSLSITPVEVFSDTVGISCVPGPSSDADEDTVSISYAWTIDGVVLEDTTEDLITTFETDNVIECTAMPNDGRENGASYTASVTVSNHEPVVTTVSITPQTDIFVGETLTCSASATDTDGHSLSIMYRWVDVNGTLLSTDSTLSLTSATTYPGDLHCVAVVDDGFGGVVESTQTVQVQNSMPEWTQQAVLSLTDASGSSTSTAFTAGTATCSATASDDDDGDLTVQYSWLIAGVEVATGSSWTIDAASSDVGDTVICSASATDTYGETITSTASLTISNTLPVVTVTLEPTTATVVDTLTCSVTAIDPDQQELTYTYAWRRNGTDEPDWLNLESITGLFSKSDDIQCLVTPSDGINFGDPNSGSIVISNALPTVDSIEFSETDLYTDSTIQVVASGSDADGESIIFQYDWYRKRGETTDLVQTGGINSLDSSFFEKNDVVYVEIFADDGTELGLGVLSQELTIQNTPPQEPIISITPRFPRVDQDLVCQVDTDSVDIDEDTSTYSVSWTKNGTPFTNTQTTSITGDTIALSALLVTDSWVCTITPNDGVDDGTSIESYVTIGGGDLFDGTFGSTWEILQTAPSNVFSLMTYMTGDFPYLWNASGDYLSFYDPTNDDWEYITALTPYDGIMKSMAPVQDMLYMVRNESIYHFDPNTETWQTLNSYSGGDDINQTTSDYHGRVYGYASSGSIIEYDIESDTVQEYATGLGSLYETRIAYDPTEESLFFGAYNSDKLYQYDLNTQTLSEKTSIPESPLNTIFCGDRSGHLYVAGGYFGKTMWQYTMATDSWQQLPDLTFDHGNNGSCSVSEDGYLYVGFGSLLRLQRISLGMQ